MPESYEEKIHRSVSLRELKIYVGVSRGKNFKMKTTFGFFRAKYSGEILWRFLQSIDQSGASNWRDHILSPNRNREFSKY